MPVTKRDFVLSVSSLSLVAISTKINKLIEFFLFNLIFLSLFCVDFLVNLTRFRETNKKKVSNCVKFNV